jgi:hypothetical protein
MCYILPTIIIIIIITIIIQTKHKFQWYLNSYTLHKDICERKALFGIPFLTFMLCVFVKTSMKISAQPTYVTWLCEKKFLK